MCWAAAATVNCFRVLLFGWQQTNCVLRFVLLTALLLSAQRFAQLTPTHTNTRTRRGRTATAKATATLQLQTHTKVELRNKLSSAKLPLAFVSKKKLKRHRKKKSQQQQQLAKPNVRNETNNIRRCCAARCCCCCGRRHTLRFSFVAAAASLAPTHTSSHS